MSLWRSDKFLLTLSVYCVKHNSTEQMQYQPFNKKYTYSNVTEISVEYEIMPIAHNDCV